ncbi:MAG: gliding motility-associated C-terminal domain-containing protein [Flavobacteriales bacterium]|nr:gliding motility-associated C-terminal domain-containing protein [Flavobacteriales bacterium]MCB9191594.1 gliding motility-associated C-terminal domain-containing protein [Flavobacteriales bacterium]MCB9204409.1 gliding motility-associated C-terminal domain-containing protein [Flavobacteriales bacterium]
MKRLILLLTLIFLFLGFKQTSATHIVGGELVYTYLGASQYAITLVVYRDCLGGQAAFDNPANVGIFNASGTLVQNLNFSLDSVVTLQSTINSSCVTAPNNVCTEAGYYTEIVTLPPIVGGYTIAYQRCCRNSVVQNITDPGDVGATYVATIPGSESQPANSSPIWSQLPPLYVCVNLPFQFNHSAFDLDGDSLVYSLCTPFEGATSTAPQPDPPGPPPYVTINWEPPYSLTDMLGGPVPLTINSTSGQINATPDAIGTYVIGLCVQEYRNGVLLGETRRGIQINVVNCQAPVALPDDVNEISPNSFINCTEFVDFDAFNSAGFEVWWNFGDPTTLADTAVGQSTSWVYPGPGTYDLTLVVYNPINPNDPLCTDTTVQTITVQDTVIPVAGADTATCPGIPVQIGSPATPGWTYQWSPTTGLDNPNIAQPTATITADITYVLTAFDAEGCSGQDSITVSLLANSAADAGPDISICPGDTAQLQASGGQDYLWFPNVFIDNVNISNPQVWPVFDTEYIVEVTNADGCVGYDTLLVSLFEPQLTVSQDETICLGDTAQISANGASTYTWSPITNISDNSISNPEVWPSSTTAYVVEAIDANGCELIDSVVITVQPLPLADAGADDSVCIGNSVQLGASGGTIYSWSPAGSLSNPNVANPDASPSSTTTYTVTVSDQFGCEALDSVLITVNPLPTVDAGQDGIVCNGQGVQLNASGAVTYSWSPTAGLDDPNIANPIALPSLPTDYVVEGTDANGCVNTDTVFVDVFVVDAIGDTVICIGDAAQLGAIGGTSWTWSPATGLSDANAQNPIADSAVTTVYTVTADDGTGCLATDSVTVVVSPLPTAFAGFDQGVCAGNTAQLNATGGVVYSWSPAAGLSDPNISNPIVTFSSDTVTYTVTVTDAIGCSNSDSVTVWQEPLPDAVAGPDTTICFGQSAQLFAGGGETYIWSPATGLNNPNVQNPIATPQTTTTYTVTVGQTTGNLVFNGDFSLGNVGFGSDYAYSNNLVPESLYGVVTNANTVHPSFQGVGHTGNAPVDSFMVVNGSGTPNQNVWCQTVSVSPNTDYYFGAWVSTVVASSPAILQFSINGQVLGTPFTAPFNINNWTQFFETWNSGTATTATICVVNQNTNTGGNDFALDDITFSTFCTNTAEVTVTVNPLPEADAGEDQTICIGDVTQMEGSGGVTYLWVPPIGLDDPTNPTTDADPTITTTYTLIVEDNIGCSDTDQMTLTVNPLPAANAGPNREVCIGESVVLEGSGGTDYVWSPGTYLDDANAQLPISTPDQTITYTVTVTDANSCVNTDSVQVIVNPLPIVDAGLDSMICENGSLVLQATGADTYVWTPLIGLSDPQSANPTASPLDPTTYFVTGTDVNGCVNSDSVNITIFGVIAGPDSVICLNDSVQAFVSGGSTFSWSPSAGVSDTASASPFLSPDINTSYVVTVISEFGCEASAEVNIEILTLPVSGFTAEFEPSCDGIFAAFQNESENAETYYWSFGDGTTSSEFEPTHTFEPGQGSIVTLITYNNDSLCVDSIIVDYSGQWFGNDTIDIKYSTAFTPNFDGINDCFRPGFDGRFSECYQLTVYNRWGALIFESTGGQDHCWDGYTKGGKRCEEGTYYYIVSLKGYEKHGYVTLVD